MRTKHLCLVFTTCLLGGCATHRAAPPGDRVMAEVGWFSALHDENPHAMIDVGWQLVLRRGADETCRWYVGGRERSESEMREILSRLRKAGMDGVLLDAEDNVSVGFVTKTLTLLHQYGQRHVVLFQLVEGVQSDFFSHLERFRRDHPEIFEEEESNHTSESSRQPVDGLPKASR
jgi:hypothetical protein